MDQGVKEGISGISLLMKQLFIGLSIFPDIWTVALEKFINKENPWGESESRLQSLFFKAGWTPEQMLLLESKPGVLTEFHALMFPSPFFDLPIEQVITEQALEEALPGHGMMYKVARDKILSAGIKTFRRLAGMKEAQAVRVFGSNKNKAFRAVEALLVKHGGYFGMRLL